MAIKNERASFRISNETANKLEYIFKEDERICAEAHLKSRPKSDVFADIVAAYYNNIITNSTDVDVSNRVHEMVDSAVDRNIIHVGHDIQSLKGMQNELAELIHNLEHQNELLLKGLSVVLRSDLITNPDNFKKEQIFAYLDRESNWMELIKEWMEINK